jgi:hypothetical protein
MPFGPGDDRWVSSTSAGVGRVDHVPVEHGLGVAVGKERRRGSRESLTLRALSSIAPRTKTEASVVNGRRESDGLQI